MRLFAGMKRTLRGRPKLNLKLEDIIKAVQHHRQVVAAARQLACSPAYVPARLKEAGITLAEILDRLPPTGSPFHNVEEVRYESW